MYPEPLVKPMKAEMTAVGFQELVTPDDVDSVLKKEKGTTLVFINSVCGCAAANARPAVISSIQNSKRPTNLTTVFAGVDGEAVAKAREFMFPFPPSSPSIALFKDGKLVHFIERHMIEGRPVKMIADNLVAAYEAYC